MFWNIKTTTGRFSLVRAIGDLLLFPRSTISLVAGVLAHRLFVPTGLAGAVSFACERSAPWEPHVGAHSPTFAGCSLAGALSSQMSSIGQSGVGLLTKSVSATER